MPRLTDRNAIRAILDQDRAWSAYALGDLAPGFFEKCQWFCSHESRPENQALALVYLGFGIPVLIALGDDARWPDSWSQVKNFLGDGREVYVGVRPAVMDHMGRHHQVNHEKPMFRMRFDHRAAKANRAEPFTGKHRDGAEKDGVQRLGAEHARAVATLYDTGEAAGERPDFYSPDMLSSGVFFGAFENDDLVAVAGTHLVYTEESVAALGNIFTRADRRGRGLGTLTTRAVLGTLLEDRYQTVILNVHRQNHPAQHIYEHLGFRVHCPYFEAIVRI